MRIFGPVVGRQTGRLVSKRGSAYSYLPDSVLQFPQREGFLARMAAAGFTNLSSRDMNGGIVCLYQGRRLDHPEEAQA